MLDCDHISCHVSQLQFCAKGSPSQGVIAQSQSFIGQSGTSAPSTYSYTPSSTSPLPSVASSAFANNVFAATNPFGQLAGGMMPNLMSSQQGQGLQALQPGYQVQASQMQPQYTLLNSTAGQMTQNVTPFTQNQGTSIQSQRLQALAAALLQSSTNPQGQVAGGVTPNVNQSAPPQGYSGLQPLQPLQATPTQPQRSFTLEEVQQLLRQSQAPPVAPPPPPHQNLFGNLLATESNVSRPNVPPPLQSAPSAVAGTQNELKQLMQGFQDQISDLKSGFEDQKAKENAAAAARVADLQSQIAARDAASRSQEERLVKELETLKLKQAQHEKQMSSQTSEAESSRRTLKAPFSDLGSRNPFGRFMEKQDRPFGQYGNEGDKSLFYERANGPKNTNGWASLLSTQPPKLTYGDEWYLDHPAPEQLLTAKELKESAEQLAGVQMPRIQPPAPVNPFAPRQSAPMRPTAPATSVAEPASLLDTLEFPGLKGAKKPDLTTRPPTELPWTQVGRAGRPVNPGLPGASAPGEPFIKDICTRNEPYHWPQNFEPKEIRRLGSTRLKEFPNAKCRLCPQKKDKADKSHCHPTILHEHRFQLLETWTEKSRPDSICGIPNCLNKNSHSSEDHGLGEWRDNPFNVKLPDEVTKKYAAFWRPWPTNASRIPFPPYYYFPGNGNGRLANEDPALRQELQKGLQWGLLNLHKGIIFSLQWVEAGHLNLTAPEYDRVIHRPYRFWPENPEKAAERKSVAGDGSGNVQGVAQRPARGQGPQRPQGTQHPQGAPGLHGDKGAQPPRGNKSGPPKVAFVNDGFGGLAHHPNLPNPCYYKDSLAWPHYDFMKAVRPMFTGTDSTDLDNFKGEWESNKKAADACLNTTINAHVHDTLAKVWDVVSLYIPHWSPGVNFGSGWKPDSILAKKLEDRRAARRARTFAQPVDIPSSKDSKNSKEKKAEDADLTRRTSERMQSCGFDKWTSETNPVGKWDEIDADDLNDQDRLHPEVMPKTSSQARSQWDVYVTFQKPLLHAERIQIIFQKVEDRVDSAAVPLVAESAKMLGPVAHQEKLKNLASLFQSYRRHAEFLCNGILEIIDSVNPADVFTVEIFLGLAKKIKQVIEAYENKVVLTIERLCAEKMLGSIIAVGLKDGRDESLKDFLLGSFLPAASDPPAQIPRIVFPQWYESHYQEVLAARKAPPTVFEETFVERTTDLIPV